ncbi:hypothetical protein HMPREF1502_4875 [Klebsiella sp. AS10]|nr:hypothetical protein A225_4346 [Klebsiella michiganensis E718]AWF50073.1 hypothetical protein CSC12_2229 [Klebsiella michiganensis]EUB41322.1 hypothetical protein HMPREF1502_4875 [Klebsiella sp. AS10]
MAITFHFFARPNTAGHITLFISFNPLSPPRSQFLTKAP